MNTPSIYVGTYAKYNDGNLMGAWLDLTDYGNHSEFITACIALHSDESDPELMFQDYEHVPEPFFSESSIDPSFWDYMTAIEDWDDDRIEALWDFINNDSSNDVTSDVAGVIEKFEDCYQGHFDGETDFAYNYVSDFCDTSSLGMFENYIDYEAFGRDLFLNGDYWMSDNGHVFLNQ